VPIGEAAGHIFGLSLLNDWSARDIQAWEGVPLGPFLAKNFVSTVSPWVVTLEALEPFRCPLPRAADDPPALPHLHEPDPAPGYDLQIEAWLQTKRSGPRAMRLSRSSLRHCHWSITQMLAHHTAGGCNLRPGDLIGTGTQSGPGPGEQGCLLELTRGGTAPVMLDDGELRRWLEDGDTVTLKAWAERPGAARIGFGACRGTVVAA
jgi:fumarylacetoacetase